MMEYIIMGFMIFALIICIYAVFIIHKDIKKETGLSNRPCETKIIERYIKEKQAPTVKCHEVHKEVRKSNKVYKPEIVIKNPNDRPILIRTVKVGDNVYNLNQLATAKESKIEINNGEVKVVSLDNRN